MGLPLILELEKQGYIVVTSVSSPEAVSNIESKGHGYIRALILDPNEVCSPRLPSKRLTYFVSAGHSPYFSSIFGIYTVPTVSYHRCR